MNINDFKKVSQEVLEKSKGFEDPYLEIFEKLFIVFLNISKKVSDPGEETNVDVLIHQALFDKKPQTKTPQQSFDNIDMDLIKNIKEIINK